MLVQFNLKAHLILLITFLVSYNSYCQSKVKKDTYCLNFLGEKFGLDTTKNNVYEGNSGIRLITPVSKVTKIKYCGKGILQTNVLTLGDPWNPYSAINEIKYNFTQCINWHIIDSLKISSLLSDSVFLFTENNKKHSIYSFKIITDSSEVEYEYINNYIASDREDFNADYYSMEPSKRLMEIIEKNKNSTKFLIKEICYFNTVTKEKHKTHFGILLYR